MFFKFYLGRALKYWRVRNRCNLIEKITSAPLRYLLWVDSDILHISFISPTVRYCFNSVTNSLYVGSSVFDSNKFLYSSDWTINWKDKIHFTLFNYLFILIVDLVILIYILRGRKKHFISHRPVGYIRDIVAICKDSVNIDT